MYQRLIILMILATASVSLITHAAPFLNYGSGQDNAAQQKNSNQPTPVVSPDEFKNKVKSLNNQIKSDFYKENSAKSTITPIPKDQLSSVPPPATPGSTETNKSAEATPAPTTPAATPAPATPPAPQQNNDDYTGFGTESTNKPNNANEAPQNAPNTNNGGNSGSGSGWNIKY